MALPAHSHARSQRSARRVYTRRRSEESVLYGVVQQELEGFLARAAARDRPVARFVERELRGFLRCGILAHGFLRVHCDGCGLDRVVAFSYKVRGFCPSYGGHRMADTAAHLVDRVLPGFPVRQWVLSVGIYALGVAALLPRTAQPHRGDPTRLTTVRGSVLGALLLTLL